MKPFIHELAGFDPLEAFAAVSDTPYSLLLDSADPNHPGSRYSFVACHPIETIESKNGLITVTNWEQQTTFNGDPFALIKERMESWVNETEHVHGLPPFQGGAAGFFGYDLGRCLETLPEKAKDNPNMPDMAIGIYDQVLAHDHIQDKTWLITHARTESEARIKQKYILRLFTQPLKFQPHEQSDLLWEPNFETPDYKDHIRKVIDYIEQGDVFQANLAQRFDAVLPENFSPFAHYLKLREVNPAPFAAYMDVGPVKISSASPEQFLRVQDGAVETRPIKGTRPHVEDPAIDRLYRNALENSEKDKAENTMIVDLLRNDLSKVCKKKSIEATELCKLETFASVHHLVSTVKGELKSSKNALDLMRACFPGGSVTGAPKIRAMEIIEELEPTRRGPYCGAMAYISFDGNMDSSVLIRTLVYEPGTVSVQSGGGIVADSKPDDEYQETFDKADAIFRSFEDSSTIHIEDLEENLAESA